MRSFSTRLFVVAVVSAVSTAVFAAPVSVKLTTDALGIGAGTTWTGASAGQAGKIFTSPIVGMGSILQVQSNGLAGPGDAFNPLLVTITSRTHLDITTFPVGYPTPNDFHSGAHYITKESNQLPDGSAEGMGVQAFTVYTSGPNLGQKQPSGAGYKVEGSTEISGGTDPGPFDPSNPNGAPHVDESVDFNFNTLVFATSLRVSLANFSSTEQTRLDVMLQGGGMMTYPNLKAGDAGIVATSNSSTYFIDFSQLPGLNPTDVATFFSVRAIDPDPAHPKGTAEHFLVSGFLGDSVPLPTPGAFGALALGLGFAARRRRAA